MKKKLIGLAVLGGAAALTLASCGADNDVFHIYCWNTEFQGFFNKYISDEKSDAAGAHHLDGKEVKWTQVTSDNGAYQQSLDEALKNNANAKKSNKVDMFLAEADYILKYADSKYTTDISELNVTDFSQAYQYTVDAAKDSSGKVKGVSFQCCPSGMIYRKDIAEAVWGTGEGEPDKVQARLDSWAKWEAAAAEMKTAGYLMTGSYADTYRVFSNNAAAPWMDKTTNKATVPAVIEQWMTQAETFVNKGYTKTEGVWDAGKTTEFQKSGKVFCTFGPAWYYNFCMGTALNGVNEKATDADKAAGLADADGNKLDADGNPVYVEGTSSKGLWRVVKGPQAHFWGGTWAMAAAGGDDNELVAKVLKACLSKEFSLSLLKNEGQYSNNKAANSEYATQNTAGNAFLGGQNDTAIWASMAGDISFKNVTLYDQYFNEDLQTEFVKYLKGNSTKDAAIAAFKSSVKTKVPTVVW